MYIHVYVKAGGLIAEISTCEVIPSCMSFPLTVAAVAVVVCEYVPTAGILPIVAVSCNGGGWG